MRMVDRVHHHAANRRTDTRPALLTGLAELAQAVLRVADFTDGGAAFNRDATHFAGAKTQRCIALLTSDQLDRRTGGTRDLRTLARLHLDAVDRRTDRDRTKRQAVARLDRRVGTRHETVTHHHALRRDDVAALAVGVAQQRDVRGAVRVVFKTLDNGGNAFLVALEVDDAVRLLVTAAAMTRGDATVVVAATRLRLRFGQGRVRGALVQTFGAHADSVAASRGGRLVSDQCHLNLTPGSGLGRHVDRVTVGEAHVGLTLALAVASAEAERLDLALRVHEVHVHDLDVEEGFHGCTDIGLGRLRRHDENVLVVLSKASRLLGDVRRAKRVERAFGAHASHSSTFLTASTVMTT